MTIPKGDESMGELKACPFCGGKAELRWDVGPRKGFRVACCTANCTGWFLPTVNIESYGTPTIAIGAWNRRPAESEGEEKCDVCGKLLIEHDFSRPCSEAELIATLKQRIVEQREELNVALEEVVRRGITIKKLEAHQAIFQEVYDSEINFRISCFWDGCFDIKVGDEINGWKMGRTADRWDQIGSVLEQMVLEVFPDSDFARARKEKHVDR